VPDPASALLPHPGPDSGPLDAPAPDLSLLEGLHTFRIETWGCQMNEHDSEKMAGVLEALGLTRARSAGEADVVLLNTCSVRERAAQKVFGRLGRLRRYKRLRPNMVIGVCGCVAQQEQQRIFDRAPFVDIVMAPRTIASLPRLIAESRLRRHAIAVIDPRDRLSREPAAVSRVSRTRAWITVMEGCNKNCTFCIVPYTRGREACRAPESILAEARDCVASGLSEIELLGQNVNAWRHGAWDFTRLLTAVARISGLRRLWFTTSHPLHFKNSIIEAMAAEPAIARFLHLPVQSGSDTVLSLMHRGYTAAQYRDRIARLRDRIPDVALSTDVIVGFPGETAADFEATLELINEIRFDSIYSFTYSARPGTPAASLQNDIAPEGATSRLHRLQAAQDAIQESQMRRLEGTLQEVLVEGPSPRGGGQLTGRTHHHRVVNFTGDPSMVGRIIPVRISRAGAHSLTGTPLLS